ncbi:hypothetical protein [Cupriavidus sp. RAF12]|uniref:hypothetical protein n=1 Tax=Cupriavidus sp. RAF12 TaxID=3233050 RepID=UPI003F92F8D6
MFTPVRRAWLRVKQALSKSSPQPGPGVSQRKIPLSAEEIQRNAYLHEAGHAIVALELGLVVHSVVCDGYEGFCDAEQSQACQAAIQAMYQQPITTTAALKKILDAYFPKLATLLGGIAGESLELGRPIFSTRRAADDFSSFFGVMALISKRLTPQESDPIWMATYSKAQDDAWRVVSEREADVRRVAAELERVGTISGSRLLGLVRRSPPAR